MRTVNVFLCLLCVASALAGLYFLLTGTHP